MQTITLTHQHQPVALGARPACGLPRTSRRCPADTRKRLVAFMAFYARDILTGTLPGPYSDADAERFARLALIDPDIIKRHPHATRRSAPDRGARQRLCVVTRGPSR